MTARTSPPPVGAPDTVRFPRIEREALGNALDVWVIEAPSVPTATVALVVGRGTGADPADQAGLAGVATDLLDEGAGSRDAIGLADAFADLGCELTTEVGPDITLIGFSALASVVPSALHLLSDIVCRPRMDEPDFRRVIELRQARLVQRSRSASAVADRALLTALFGGHPYGRGALGTTASLDRMQVADARRFWEASFAPEAATLVVAGAVRPAAVVSAARAAFGGWVNPAFRRSPVPPVDHPPDRSVLFVERPGAAQSELRVGHLGPPRAVAEYHGLLVLDAALGGQFSSRINRNLRETRGLTYGARTAFGFRRAGGSFVCDASVQSDRTAEAALEVLREFEAIRVAGSLSQEELVRAKDALSRGYVRNFETATQYARAATQLVTYGLDDDTFDRFVPAIEAVEREDIDALARRFVRPDDASVVVVGDRAQCLASLETLGRPVVVVTPEF